MNPLLRSGFTRQNRRNFGLVSAPIATAGDTMALQDFEGKIAVVARAASEAGTRARPYGR